MSMTNKKALRATTGLLVILLLVIGGCARMPNIVKTQLRPKSLLELEGYVLNNRPTLDLFRQSGPFEVQRHDNREIMLSAAERFDTDWFVSGHAQNAPLVVFVHGHGNSKDSHAYQALHVASWGMHALTLQLPPEGPWLDNGKALVRIVDFIQRQPEAFGVRFDVNRIVLVGHSFGGAAVAIALADKARVAGGILLDPATYGRNLPNYLRRIDVPVLVLGADERVSSAVNRNYFFGFIRSGVTEVSVADASHEDAQFPADGAHTTEALQISFASAITAASFSLALTRRFEHAWASFRDDFANGKLINGRKK
jgi:pimeloyl-ACP methyl ester carboxylesterase